MLNDLITQLLGQLAPTVSQLPSQSLSLWAPLLVAGFIAGLVIRFLFLSKLRKSLRLARTLEAQVAAGKDLREAVSAPGGKAAPKPERIVKGKKAAKPEKAGAGGDNEMQAVVEALLKQAAEGGHSAAAVVQQVLSARRGFLPSAGKRAVIEGLPRLLIVGGLFSAAVGVMHALGGFDPAGAANALALRTALTQFQQEIVAGAEIGLLAAVFSAAMAVVSLLASPSAVADQIKASLTRALEPAMGGRSEASGGEAPAVRRPAWSQAKAAPSQEFPPTASIPIVAKQAVENEEVTGELDVAAGQAETAPAAPVKPVSVPTARPEKPVAVPPAPARPQAGSPRPASPEPKTSKPEVPGQPALAGGLLVPEPAAPVVAAEEEDILTGPPTTALPESPASLPAEPEEVTGPKIDLSDLGMDLNPPADRSDGAPESSPSLSELEENADAVLGTGEELWSAKRGDGTPASPGAKDEMFSGLSMEAEPGAERDRTFDSPAASEPAPLGRETGALPDGAPAGKGEELWGSAPSPGQKAPLRGETSALVEEEEVTRDFPLFGEGSDLGLPDAPAAPVAEESSESTSPGMTAEELWNSSPTEEPPKAPPASRQAGSSALAPAVPAGDLGTSESFEALLASAKQEAEAMTADLSEVPFGVEQAPKDAGDGDTVTMHELSTDDFGKLDADFPILGAEPPAASGESVDPTPKPKAAPHSLQDQVDDYLQAGRQSGQSKERIAQLMREQTDLDHAVEKAYQDRLAGKISEEMFNEKHRKWKTVKAQNDAELAKLRAAETGPKAA